MSKILTLPLACSVCGQHCKRAAGSITTGYGINEKGERVCFACCAVADREFMVKNGNYSGLYLTPDGNGWSVSNWPGSLKFRAFGTRHSWHNFAGKNGRTDAWFNGPDGHVWHVVRIGNMDLCRARRTKETWRKVERVA